MTTIIVILSIAAATAYIRFFFVLLTSHKNSTPNIEVLKEIKETIDLVNTHSKILNTHMETFKIVAKNELGFNSEIKQLKHAVVELQNMVINARVEDD